MNRKMWRIGVGGLGPILLFGPFVPDIVTGHPFSLPFEDEYPLASALVWLGLVLAIAFCAMFVLRPTRGRTPLSTGLRIVNGIVAVLASLMALLLVLYTLHPV